MRLDPLPPSAPVWGGATSRAVGRVALRILGWRIEGSVPDVPRCVVILAPHTSNWDFVVGLLARFALNVPVTWAGKDNLFRWPWRSLWRRLGGIPVNRRERTGFVGQMIEAFAVRERMLLAIAPEGTRQRTDHWKSGFYRVAVGAGVPIVMAFIDFPRREVGVGGSFTPSGDAVADVARLRAFYGDKTGRHPQQAGPIALRPDSGAGAARAAARADP